MAAPLLSSHSRNVPDTAGNVRHAAINIEGESDAPQSGAFSLVAQDTQILKATQAFP